jgi:hypothetical protein
MTGRRLRARGIRRVTLAAAACAIAGVGAASAQTIVVRNATPGATIELVVNAAAIGSISADDRGRGTLTVPQAPGTKLDMKSNLAAQKDMLLFGETCENKIRLLMVERGAPPAAQEAGCVRREIPGLFLIRPLSTLVFDFGGSSPSVLLRQRPFDPDAGPRTWRLSPEGLVFFGGGSHTGFREMGDVACGSVSGCYRDESGPGFTFGVAYWVLPYAAAEVSYVRPKEASVVGAGDSYDFESTLDADVLTLAGMSGFAAGPLRVYGKGGLTYHRATFTTVQTHADQTTTIDEVTTTIPGGTQTLAFRTTGWGWMFGGGAETWLTRAFAFYGEFGWVRLKGKDEKGGEGRIDDSLMLLSFGVKLHVGR